MDNRPAHRRSVSTSGRGSSRGVTPGSRTMASPARRPAGTRMTSPVRRASRDAATAPRPFAGCRARLRGFPLRELLAQRHVLAEVATIATHSRGVLVERLLVASDLGYQARDATVGLELRERCVEQCAGSGPAHLTDQIDRHVVRRAERGSQRVRPGRGQTCHPGQIDVRAPQTTACPSISIPRRPARPVSCVYSPGVISAWVSPLNFVSRSSRTHAGWHVDAQSERLGGEHSADQTADEQLFDRLFERWYQAGMVCGHPAAQPVEPFPVSEHLEVFATESRPFAPPRAR